MANLKWQILIPTTRDRTELLKRLTDELDRQITALGLIGIVDYFIYETTKGTPTIGAKRNFCLDQCRSEYVSFFDDDDMPTEHYISKMWEGVQGGFDCCSLRGIITTNGEVPEVFEHSLRYNAWQTNHTGAIKYERYPNHLNVMKTSIAKQMRFPEQNHGEDHEWSTALHKSGLIKSEYYVDEVIYNYLYIANK